MPDTHASTLEALLTAIRNRVGDRGVLTDPNDTDP